MSSVRASAAASTMASGATRSWSNATARSSTELPGGLLHFNTLNLTEKDRQTRFVHTSCAVPGDLTCADFEETADDQTSAHPHHGLPRCLLSRSTPAVRVARRQTAPVSRRALFRARRAPVPSPAWAAFSAYGRGPRQRRWHCRDPVHPGLLGSEALPPFPVYPDPTQPTSGPRSLGLQDAGRANSAPEGRTGC